MLAFLLGHLGCAPAPPPDPDVLARRLQAEAASKAAYAESKHLDGFSLNPAVVCAENEPVWLKEGAPWSEAPAACIPPLLGGRRILEREGLEIAVMVEGEAPLPPHAPVAVAHHLWLADSGQRVTTSANTEPAVFLGQSGRAIKAWDIALTHLGPGARARLLVPSTLAYGKYGGGGVPPHTDLVYDIHILNPQ